MTKNEKLIEQTLKKSDELLELLRELYKRDLTEGYIEELWLKCHKILIMSERLKSMEHSKRNAENWWKS